VRERLTSDLGVYALSGLFSLVVFVVALAILSTTLPDGLGDRQLAGLVVGYLLFVGVYAIAWFIYTEIDSREEI
jgi:phage shock protein PspC (stress-responsive transcriptional regulator)